MDELRDVNDELPLFRYYLRKVHRHPTFRAWRVRLSTARLFGPDMLRLATQRFRQLPTVVMVGAQKAGTTQLHAYMSRHPRCLRGANKEVDYFSKEAHRSLAWYQSRFPLQYWAAARRAHVIEASPSYMAMPTALRHMREVLPAAQILVLLRDPVSRAFSHFQHRKTRHREPLSFAEAVDAELRRNTFRAERGAGLRHGAPAMMDYVSRGYYALQMELLYALYPREQVLVMDSAELFADTNSACQRVFDFLGLEHLEIEAKKIYNRGYYKEKIDPFVAERLREHYRPHDALLREVVGVEFSWMRAKRVAA